MIDRTVIDNRTPTLRTIAFLGGVAFAADHVKGQAVSLRSLGCSASLRNPLTWSSLRLGNLPRGKG